jgi:predicted nuclease of predicted toxin-antitoxin system
VKLLFDENLSARLVHLLENDFPESAHVDDVGLRGGSDEEIWTFSAAKGYVIVSKDSDFRQMSFVRGSPPKVVWLDIGNSGTREIAIFLKEKSSVLHAFNHDKDSSFLELS